MTTDEEYRKIIQELRNALIVSANNAHDRKQMVNELNPARMFYNELQFQSLVESALDDSKSFKSEYESDMALNWKRETLRNKEPVLSEGTQSESYCPDQIPKQCSSGNWNMCKTVVGDCQWICEHELCPRGYQKCPQKNKGEPI